MPFENKKTPEEFYNECITSYHEEAKRNEALEKGLIFIPELMSIGQKMILTFLQDPFFQSQFGNDSRIYYYVMLSLAIESGIAVSAKWHEDFGSINTYTQQLINEGPADEANTLLIKHFPESVSSEQGNPFFNKIYKVMLEKHEPYWQLQDCRAYTFNALLAGFQLGISMMLGKLGY